MTQETQGKPENGDVFDGDGNHIGSVEVPTDEIDLVCNTIQVFMNGQMYVFSFNYRQPAEMENHAQG